MTMKWQVLLKQTQHRPWQLPRSPWLITMSWRDVLAIHWPVDSELLVPSIAPGLELDTWQGQAWVSLFPLEMAEVAPRGFLWWPRKMRFPEMNLRTYVTARGEKPGVWFYSLDAASKVAVWGARSLLSLPYLHAEMQIESYMKDGEQHVEYKSRRVDSKGPSAEFRARYGPTAEASPAAAGSFDDWVMERYCLYTKLESGQLMRLQIHHRRWPLQPAWVEIGKNTMGATLGLNLSNSPRKAHFTKKLDVMGWAPERIA